MFCNGKLSNTIELDIGVPQGSTLGSILFLVYINDLSQAISDGYNNMFADDACFYRISKIVSEVQMPLQKCVTNAVNTIKSLSYAIWLSTSYSY